MKVYIGNYVNNISIYSIEHILEFFCILERDREWIVKKLEGTKLDKFLEWVNTKQQRKISIKTHKYDHWNAYETIAMIALPILKNLRLHKQGSPYISDDDVPERLKSINAPLSNTEDYVDSLFFERYDWVLGEVIWALEQITIDYESQYWIERPIIEYSDSNQVEWLCKGLFDEIGYKQHQKRIDNGLLLMGKYFQTFWD